MQVLLVQAGSCLLGSSYGYTIWCTTLVQLVTFGAAWLVRFTFVASVCAIGIQMVLVCSCLAQVTI